MTIHPLLRLVATQPELLAAHVQAYAALIGDDVGQAAAALARRTALAAAAAALAVLACVFAGTALMLWAVAPLGSIHTAWLLWAVPALPAVLAGLCMLARQRHSAGAFDTLKQQMAADMSLLREAGSA